MKFGPDVFFGRQLFASFYAGYRPDKKKNMLFFWDVIKPLFLRCLETPKKKNIAKKRPYRWEPWKQKTTFEVILSDGDPDNYKMNRTVKLSWENQLFGNQLKVISKLPKPSRSRAEAKPKPKPKPSRSRSRAGAEAEAEPTRWRELWRNGIGFFLNFFRFF